jgi:PAS domain S-box-containing protein
VSVDWNAFASECPVALVAVRGDGTVGFANRAAAALLGYGLAELEEANVSSLVPVALYPEPTVSWVRHLSTLAKRGGAGAVSMPIVHRTGAQIESTWLVVEGHDETGRELGVLVLTDRKSALSEVREDVAVVHRVIFENAPLGIFYFDARGIITACNDRFVEIIGSSKRHLLGLDMSKLKNEHVVGALARCLGGEPARWEGDYTSLTAGKRTGVRMVLEPIKGPTGEVVAGLGLVEDVTETRRAQELVARTERLASLGTFAAGVALDVEAPLALALANVELASRRVHDPATQKEDLALLLDAARDGVSSVVDTLRRLKTIARDDSSPRCKLDVATVVKRGIASVDAASLDGVEIAVEAEPVPPVVANEARLEQAFHALVTNAVQAVKLERDAERRVVVRIRPAQDERVRIEVEDTGPGIARDVSARIFEPFWTDRGDGQGLGLAVAQGVVSSLGGELFLDQSRPVTAKGARFVVLLPSALEDERAAASDRSAEPDAARASPGPTSEPKKAPPQAGASGHRGKVLVVDDEERLAVTLRLALSGRYDVDIATRGRQALALLKDHDYDVILCDLSLPDLSGIDVFEQTRRERPEVGARFVFLTGGAFQTRTRAFLQSVDNARLDKPFDLDALERLLASRVGAHPPD